MTEPERPYVDALSMSDREAQLYECCDSQGRSTDGSR
jgi:hypothetical protein